MKRLLFPLLPAVLSLALAAAPAALHAQSCRVALVLALDISTGNIAWELPVPSEPVEAIAFSSDRVCVTTSQGGIHVAHPEDGRLLWNSEGHGEFRHAPTIVENRVVTVDERGRLLVHRLGDGTPLWSYVCGSPAGSPVGGNARRIVVVDEAPKVHLVPLASDDRETSSSDSAGSGAERRFAGR